MFDQTTDPNHLVTLISFCCFSLIGFLIALVVGSKFHGLTCEDFSEFFLLFSQIVDRLEIILYLRKCSSFLFYLRIIIVYLVVF